MTSDSNASSDMSAKDPASPWRRKVARNGMRRGKPPGSRRLDWSTGRDPARRHGDWGGGGRTLDVVASVGVIHKAEQRTSDGRLSVVISPFVPFAHEPRDVDLAMVLGTGFPPFRGGLLRHADAVGIPIVADRLARLADAHGERFRPATLLSQMVREQRRFYPAEA